MLPTPDKSSLVNRLWIVQNGRCFHCGKPMLCGVENNHGHAWSREHIYPVSRYGRDAGNIVLAHRKCNSKRGNPEPSEDEIERARAIFAVLGLVAFPDVHAPSPRSIGTMADVWPAGVAEQVDALGLNPGVARRGSSSLPARTTPYIGRRMMKRQAALRRQQLSAGGHDVEFGECRSTQEAARASR